MAMKQKVSKAFRELKLCADAKDSSKKFNLQQQTRYGIINVSLFRVQQKSSI